MRMLNRPRFKTKTETQISCKLLVLFMISVSIMNTTIDYLYQQDHHWLLTTRDNVDSLPGMMMMMRRTTTGIISNSCPDDHSPSHWNTTCSNGDKLHPNNNNNINSNLLDHNPNDDDDDDDNNPLRKSFNGGPSDSRTQFILTKLWQAAARRIQSSPIIVVADAIRLIRVEAPSSVEIGKPIKLRCLYELRGEKLQSLAWYKNGREFYRYQPFERRQPVLIFSLNGINVDMSRSKNSTVHLTNTTLETTGRYKCEATSTTFREANQEVFIRVTEPESSGSFQRVYLNVWILPYLTGLLLLSRAIYPDHEGSHHPYTR